MGAAATRRPIAVVVADGQPLFLDGLARAIRQDRRLRLVAAREDGRAALDAIRELRPDVAVVELGLPALDGRRVAAAVARDTLPTAVVVLTDDPGPAAFEAVAGGARGCLSKRVEAAAVRDAVVRVATGEAVLCREHQSLLAREIQLRHRGERDLLNARQCEVLGLMAEGLTNGQMAPRLGIAPSTVKTYCRQIYQRLAVRDRTEAVAEGMRRGLLD
jgi:two-component system, NarL family, nitrate/nitrite response regulator NarL